MKSEVLNYFKSLPKSLEEQFNTAFQLFRKCPAKSMAQLTFYNRAGFSKNNLKSLHYDLKKAAGVSDAEIKAAIRKENENKVVVPAITLESNLDDISNEELVVFITAQGNVVTSKPTFEKGAKGNAEMKKYCKELNITSKTNKSVDLQEAIDDFYRNALIETVSNILNANKVAAKTETEKLAEKIIELTGATTPEEVFTKAPENIKTQIKLRDEFPFLNDDDCPEEFYILVGKKFNHYDAYVAAHKSLLVKIKDTNQDASPIELTPEEIDTLAQKAVENFEVNQLIWNELNHYKETGKVLGKHPIFMERKLKESVEALTVEKALKRITALEKNIKRNQEKVDTSKTDADKEKYQRKVEEYTIELNLIKVKFNFSDAK